MMMFVHHRRAARGFTLVELAIVLGVSSVLFAGLWRLMSSGGQQMRDQSVASQHQQLVTAVKGYLTTPEGQNLMAQTPVAGGIFNLSLPTLATNCVGSIGAANPGLCNYLPAGFSTATTNAYGQNYGTTIPVLAGAHAVATPPQSYSFMIPTYGGTAIPDASGGRVSSLIGGDGGFVYRDTDVCNGTLGVARTAAACGAFGSWASTTATYGVTTAGGHVATRTFIASDQDVTNPWLWRIGTTNPNVYNTMSTDLFLSSSTATRIIMGGANNGLYMSTGTALTSGGGTLNLQNATIYGTTVDDYLASATSNGGALLGLTRAEIGSSTGSTTGAFLTVNAPTGGTAIQANGNVSVTGTLKAASFIYASDERLKQDIVELEHPLEDLMKLRAVSFKFRDSGRKSEGVIAQDVEKVYPELVSIIQKDFKGVDYYALIGPLIGAVKQLKHENDTLRETVSDLQKRLQQLEARVDSGPKRAP